MSSLNTLYIKLDVLKTLVNTLEKKSERGIELTVSLGNEANTYGQNVSAWVSQSREDREMRKDRYFVGNGRTVWSQGETPVPEKIDIPKNETKGEIADEGDLPF